MRRHKTLLLVLTAIVVLLVGVRLALPYIVKEYVNDRLANLQAYTGSVRDVHLALWRGAYRVDGIRIDKRHVDQPTPFFEADRVDFSVEWRSLFKGSLVAKGAFVTPKLNLVQGNTERDSQTGRGVNWAGKLKELFPFDFNTIEVHEGTVTFRAPGIRTQDSLTGSHLNGSVSNLTNVVTTGKETFAEFRISGTVLRTGVAKVAGSVNPVAPQPTFDVNLTVEKVKLPEVNPWLRQYIKADAEAGDFDLYVELAAADGRFKGYAKPVMQDVKMLSIDEKDEDALHKAWEAIVQFAANLFENKEEDQVAARIPFRGTIENPKASILETIASVLRNAFVAAFARSLEGSISLRDVEQNLSEYDNRKEEKAAKDDDRKVGKKHDERAEDEDQKQDDENRRPRAVGPRAQPIAPPKDAE